MVAGAAPHQAVYRLALWIDGPAKPTGNGRAFYEHRTKNRRRIKRYSEAPDDALDDLWPERA
jgi:hypothetical protein